MRTRERVRGVAVGLLVAAAALLPACEKTLTEELPVEPTAQFSSPVPQQVTVVPVPVPVPTSAPAPAPGGGAPPPSTPAPSNPTNPTPKPTGTPTPSGVGGGGGGSAVVRVGAHVFFVECDGTIVDGKYASTAKVGCRIHFDCTPRDANNNETTAKGTPSWSFSPASLVSWGGGGNPYTPGVRVLASGTLTAWVTIDGVRSNDVRVKLVD